MFLSYFLNCFQLSHFTVVCLVAWPLNGNENGGDLVLIEILLLFLCKSLLISMRPASVTEEQRGLYQNKVNSSLTFIQRTKHTTVKWPILFIDLTTYDTVKHFLIGHTSLQDNWITHTISRYYKIWNVIINHSQKCLTSHFLSSKFPILISNSIYLNSHEVFFKWN